MSLVSDGSFWTVAPMELPDVEAIVTLNYPFENDRLRVNNTRSSTDQNSTIIVPLYCSLILFCQYNTPFVWLKDGEPIPKGRKDIFDYYNQMDARKTPTTEATQGRQRFIYPIYRRFGGSIRIKNVTMDMEGMYTCAMKAAGGDKNMTSVDQTWTTIRLLVQTPAPTNESRVPQILFSPFDHVRYSLDWGLHFHFVCFAPNETIYKAYFVLPNDRIVNVTGSRWLNGIGISSKTLSTFDASGHRVWTSRLALHTTLAHQGDYSFVFEYAAENGTWIKLVRHIKLTLYSVHYNLAERPLSNEFRTYLMVGRYYKMTFWTNYVRLKRGNEIINAEMEAFSQSSHDCGYNPVVVTGQSMFDECGVISVIKKYVVKGSPANAVDINVRAIRSCSFRIRVWASDESVPNITTYLNATAIDGLTYSDRDFSDKEAERTIVVSQPEGERYNAQRYTNDSFLLRCQVPACDWEMLGWCMPKARNKRCAWLLWKDDVVGFEGTVADDPGIKVSFVRLNNVTVAFDMRIDWLRLNHTGEYGCGTFKPVYKPRRLGETFSQWFNNPENRFSLPLDTFRLDVLQPQEPVFSANETNFSMKRGKRRDLRCEVDGSPRPSITWRRYMDSAPYDPKTDVGAADAHVSDDFERFVLFPASANESTLAITEAGDYECIATNRYATRTWLFRVSYDDDAIGSQLPLALSVLGGLLILSCVIGIVVWLRHRAKAARFAILARLLNDPLEGVEGVELDERAFLNDQADLLPYKRKFEIKREQFDLLKKIGDGEFGQVYRAKLTLDERPERFVAVKTPKNMGNTNQYKALIDEMKIMNFLKPHVNVLSLIGSCTTGLKKKQELYVLTELCENGSLLGYLQRHRSDYERCTSSTDEAATTTEHGLHSLLSFSYQAANGMIYLAARNIIHRDLALRNLLLTINGVVKISDFGLSRRTKSGYSYKKSLSNVGVPIAWMALESLTAFEYTHESDIWSFGIVLWEIFTCGRTPYTDDGVSLSEIHRWLLEGNRLLQPKLATPEMYALMQECWNATPSDRPSFSVCKARIARQMVYANYQSLVVLLTNAACCMNPAADGQEQTASISNEGEPTDEVGEIQFDTNVIDMDGRTENDCPASGYVSETCN